MSCLFESVGHGRSEGDRVYIEDYSEYVDDVVQRLRMVRDEYPGVPLALFGHSMVSYSYGMYNPTPQPRIMQPCFCADMRKVL